MPTTWSRWPPGWPDSWPRSRAVSARCKEDGLAIAHLLGEISRSEAEAGALDKLNRRLESVADGARCNLATQQQVVVGSILSLFPDAVRLHAEREADAIEPMLIAALVDIRDGRAVLDEKQAEKQPDWTYDPVDSGKWPADRLDDPRRPQSL